MTNILRIAWRNFWRNLGRYRLLMAALAAAVMVQVTILGSILGLTDTLRAKAARYFGGHVVVLGYGADGYSSIRDAGQVEQALRSAAVRGATLVKRSHYYEKDATLFFAGNYHGQRRLIGVDWQSEQALLQTFDLVAGKLPAGRRRIGDPGVLRGRRARWACGWATRSSCRGRPKQGSGTRPS